MNPATLRGVIKEYTRRWREARVKRLTHVIEACTLRLADHTLDPVDEARLEGTRQQAAFKRINHLNKLEKE